MFVWIMNTLRSRRPACLVCTARQSCIQCCPVPIDTHFDGYSDVTRQKVINSMV